MSEQILSCADMCPITFQSLFHALMYEYAIYRVKSEVTILKVLKKIVKRKWSDFCLLSFFITVFVALIF